MQQKMFLKEIHSRLAQISVGASALRNQGASGLVKVAREYFENSIILDDFFDKLNNENKYKNYLDKHTEQLVKKFPANGKSWGAARKSLNLFFREIVYNKFMNDHYSLPSDFKRFNSVIRHLEVPLDKSVAVGIYSFDCTLPKWTSIKKLKPGISTLYQESAFQLAQERHTVRVHLDLSFWRK